MDTEGFGPLLCGKCATRRSRAAFACATRRGTQRLSMDHRPSDPAEARRVREEGADGFPVPGYRSDHQTDVVMGLVGEVSGHRWDSAGQHGQS